MTRSPQPTFLALLALAASACPAPETGKPAASQPAVVAARRTTPAPSPAGSAAAPGSGMPDTPETRRVIAFCERYRSALEARDAATLLELASPHYLEDGDTPDPADDVSHESLREHLEGLFGGVEQIRYQIRYRAVRFERERIIVEVSHSATYVIKGQSRSSVGDNELVLERHDGSYRFLSGM